MASYTFDDDKDFINKMMFDDTDNYYYWLNSVDRTGVVVPKALPAPILQTGSGLIQPTDGSWQARKLLKPVALLRWGFLVVEPSAHGQVDYAGIISLIQKGGRDMGMDMAQPVVQQFYVQFKDLNSTMLQSKIIQRVKLLFIVLPDGKWSYYHQVKKLSELFVGIPTQCIREQTARKGMSPQIIRNILLKVNTKLKGVNQAVDPPSMPSCLQGDEGFMIMGGHVIHPSPEQSLLYHRGVPCTIAAVTASIDPQCTMYNVQLSIQAPKKEEIVDLDDMMTEHLMCYIKHNRLFPTTIIYYRSAIPTTLYSEVEAYEKMKLIKAYRRLLKAARPEGTPVPYPKIIYVVVETPRNERLGLTSFGSQAKMKPGLVINTHRIPVDSLQQTRFSMVSHQAKSDARLTNYFIYCNGGIRHPDLERLSYNLCYLSGNCTRSLTRPTPLHYARLACRRALSLSYGMKLNPEHLEEEPRRIEVFSPLLKCGRTFFV